MTLTTLKRIYLDVVGMTVPSPFAWQTIWTDDDQRFRHTLGYIDEPNRDVWVSRLDQLVREIPEPIVLVAHGLASHALSWWIASLGMPPGGDVRGALLVAPPDLISEQIASYHPSAAFCETRLPFPTLLLRDRFDVAASTTALQEMASAWGSRMLDMLDYDSILGDNYFKEWFSS